MTNQQLAQQLAQDFITSEPADLQFSTKETNNNSQSLLDALINAFPYYQDTDFMNLHRNAIINILACYLPNDSIVPQGNDSGFGYCTSYSYNGPYSGYQNAFYPNTSLSTEANAIITQLNNTNPSISTNAWWNRFAVIIITDAVRQKNATGVDTGKLANDLGSYNATFNSCLSSSYLAIFQKAYPPTNSAINNIVAANAQMDVMNLMISTLQNGSLATNLNIALSNAGTAPGATWFLYNICITLKILGCATIDMVFQHTAIQLPAEFNQSGWWTGQYSSWFESLSGGDVMNLAGNTITASMPEKSTTIFSMTGGMPQYSYPNLGNGYAQSLCNWSSLSYYNPPSSSCFGKGTMVLMGDQTAKPIETIKKGDFVLTQFGPRKVVLIETPKRMGRKLVTIDQLQVFFTLTHPLISSNTQQGKYQAMDPWGLIDGIPTSTRDGVLYLKSGSQLTALKNNQPETYTVTATREITESQNEELVYDLILENWESDSPCYYVGGPDYFLATESETVHPLHEPFVSAVIITILNRIRDLSRQYIQFPETMLNSLLRNLNWEELTNEALNRLSHHDIRGKISLPALPKPSFYEAEDFWDPHASILEYYLVRHYGRLIRTEIQNGWRRYSKHSPTGQLILDINDMELVGASLTSSQSVQLVITAIGDDGAIIYQNQHQEALANQSYWRVHYDKSIMIGDGNSTSKIQSLKGEIYFDQYIVGTFLIPLQNGYKDVLGNDLFIHDSSKRIIGRIHLNTRFLSKEELINESMNQMNWNATIMWDYSLILGDIIAEQLDQFITQNHKKNLPV